MENMEYYTRRLQCSDAEKDACLETVAKLCHARFYLRRYGWLAAEDLAKKESDPFFRACLMDVTEGYEPESLERRYTQYLLAADCRGGAFLNALLISQGLVLLVRYENGEDFGGMSWEYVFTERLGGWFGVEYRERVTEVIEEACRRERPKRAGLSRVPAFDGLTKLSPGQRDWLVRSVPVRTLCLALKLGGTAVSEFLMEGAEDREALERAFADTTNVRLTDVEAAQWEILEKAREIPQGI